MKRYVGGFMFSSDYEIVTLIEKKKPDFLKGKLNAVGGHIEEGETILEAMIREFREKTGVEVLNWKKFLELRGYDKNGEDFEVHFFKSLEDKHQEIQSITDEKVDNYTLDLLQNVYMEHIVPNLKWIIPMAISIENDSANGFVVKEVY